MKDNNIGNLYQTSKAEKPPNSLDNFILAQAKNSCDEKKILHNTPIRKRWLFRLSTAAVVVLSFSIILNLQNENSIVTQPAEYMQKSIQKQSAPMKKKTEKSVSSPSVSSGYSENAVSSDNLEEMDTSGISLPNQDSEKRSIVKILNDKISNPVPLTPIIEIKPEPKIITEEQVQAIEEYRIKPNDSKPMILTKEAVQAIEKYRIKPDDTESIEESKKLGKIIATDSRIISDNSEPTEESEKLDEITVTGSRLMREVNSELKKVSTKPEALNTEINSDVQDFNSSEEIDTIVVQDNNLSFTQQLEQLDGLIKNQKLTDAKQLFIQLQKSYPYYDFSKYKAIFEN